MSKVVNYKVYLIFKHQKIHDNRIMTYLMAKRSMNSKDFQFPNNSNPFREFTFSMKELFNF